MIDGALREKMLDAAFIIRDFVTGETNCNYELYLIELINNSDVFMQKSNGELFKWQANQAHGESDAFTETYSVDFKLLATKTSLHSISVTSMRIVKMSDGCKVYRIGRYPQGKTFTYVRTVPALRDLSMKDLQTIEEYQKNKIEEDVSIILKTLRTKKNLLLFYPYVLSFSEPRSFEQGCESITNAFNEDLNNICAYRRKKAEHYDTFLTTIFEDRFLIFEEENGSWVIKETIEMSLSETYMALISQYGKNQLQI